MAKCFKQKQCGSALAEYCLHVFLGASIVIIGLSVLGQSISRLLKDAAAQDNLYPTLSLISSQAGPSAKAPATKAYFITPQGKKVELDTSPKANLGEVVLTSGANGATDLLADSILSTANQLKNTGEITDDQFNLLMNLANQGHRLAQIEGLIEQASTQAHGGASFQQVSVQLDGKPYPLTSIVDMIGWKGPNGDTGEAVSIANYTQANPETLAFMQLRDQALQTGPINGNPQVKALLEGLTDNILTIARDASGAAQWAQIDGAGINTNDSYLKDLSDILTSNQDMNAPLIPAAAKTTNTDSQAICTTGQGQDSGSNCH